MVPTPNMTRYYPKGSLHLTLGSGIQKVKHWIEFGPGVALGDRQHRFLRGEQKFPLLNTSSLWDEIWEAAQRVQQAFSNDSHYTNWSSLVIFVAICFVMLLRVLQSMNNPSFQLLTLGFESRLWAVCGMLEHELFIPGALDDTIPCLAHQSTFEVYESSS